MYQIDRNSALWAYLPHEIQGLIEDGELVLEHSASEKGKITDFSYVVFPFAKAYEGFLKRLFLDMDLIKDDEYYSDQIRIGRILNPHFIKQKDNIFDKFCAQTGNKKSKSSSGRELAEVLWTAWRQGRNLVFHYFPHNFRRLSYEEASGLVQDLTEAMHKAIAGCEIDVGGARKHSDTSKVQSII